MDDRMQRDGTSDARFRKNSSKQVRERPGSVRANSGLIVDWMRRGVQGESRGLRGGGPKPSPPRYKPFQSTPESLCVWPATSTPVRQSIDCGQFACQQAYHRISANCRGRESDSHWCMMLGGAQALSRWVRGHLPARIRPRISSSLATKAAYRCGPAMPSDIGSHIAAQT